MVSKGRWEVKKYEGKTFSSFLLFLARPTRSILFMHAKSLAYPSPSILLVPMKRKENENRIPLGT